VSPHSSNVLHALYIDVPCPFEANTVVSHDDGYLVFIDLDYEMLIFNPCKKQIVRIIQFSKRINQLPNCTEDVDQCDGILCPCLHPVKAAYHMYWSKAILLLGSLMRMEITISRRRVSP
jgi:hypothetical protein